MFSVCLGFFFFDFERFLVLGKFASIFLAHLQILWKTLQVINKCFFFWALLKPISEVRDEILIPRWLSSLIHHSLSQQYSMVRQETYSRIFLFKEAKWLQRKIGPLWSFMWDSLVLEIRWIFVFYHLKSWDKSPLSMCLICDWVLGKVVNCIAK